MFVFFEHESTKGGKSERRASPAACFFQKALSTSSLTQYTTLVCFFVLTSATLVVTGALLVVTSALL